MCWETPGPVRAAPKACRAARRSGGSRLAARSRSGRSYQNPFVCRGLAQIIAQEKHALNFKGINHEGHEEHEGKSDSNLIAPGCLDLNCSKCSASKSPANAPFPSCSSCPSWLMHLIFRPAPMGLPGLLQPRLQRRADEFVEVAVKHLLRIGALHAGSQVLDPRLVQHVVANLTAPADIGLFLFGRLGLLALLLQLHFVQLGAQLAHRA